MTACGPARPPTATTPRKPRRPRLPSSNRPSPSSPSPPETAGRWSSPSEPAGWESRSGNECAGGAHRTVRAHGSGAAAQDRRPPPGSHRGHGHRGRFRWVHPGLPRLRHHREPADAGRAGRVLPQRRTASGARRAGSSSGRGCRRCGSCRPAGSRCRSTSLGSISASTPSSWSSRCSSRIASPATATAAATTAKTPGPGPAGGARGRRQEVLRYPPRHHRPRPHAARPAQWNSGGSGRTPPLGARVFTDLHVSSATPLHAEAEGAELPTPTGGTRARTLTRRL